MGGEPVVAELIFHEHKVFGGLLCGADSTSRFKTDLDSCAFLIIADEAGHDESEGEGGVDGFFSGGRFDEIGPSHHAHGGGAGDVCVGAEFAGGEDRFDVGGAAGIAEGFHFIV